MKNIIWKQPKNLRTRDSSDFYFSNENQKIVYEQKIKNLTNVKIDETGLIFRNFFPLFESFSGGTLPKISYWNFLKSNYGLKNIFSFILLLKKHISASEYLIKEPLVFPIDNWSTGFFHWFADVVPRILYTKKNAANPTLLLPEIYKNFGFVNSSLEIIGIKNIRWIKKGEVVLAKKLIIPTVATVSGNYDESAIKKMREIFRAAAKKESLFGNKIYISRANAKKRRIDDEEKIKPILSKYGFRIIEPEKLSFEDQLSIFSKTKYLISIHGAGLMNMLFMPEKSSIIELRLAPPLINNCYFALASALDINYFYQKPVKKKTKNSVDFLTFSAEDLENNIKKMLFL